MNKFNQLYSRIFYEQVLRKLPVNEIQNKDFYSNLIKINSYHQNFNFLYEQFNILNESHEDSKLDKKLINLINKIDNFEQISLQDIYDNISFKLKSKYNLKIKENIPIYVFKFDFQNPTIIFKIFQMFKIHYQSEDMDLNIKQKQQHEINLFKKYVGNSLGLYFHGNKEIMLFLNIQKYNENTINHQIYHLIQDVFNIHINIEDLKEYQQIKQLQLTKQNLKYLYKKDQFQTHIKVDLINQLEQIYWKFYKDISRNAFISIFIYQSKSNPLSLYTNEIISKIIYEDIKNKDTTSLRLFLSSFLMNDKKWNNLAIKWLKEQFK